MKRTIYLNGSDGYEPGSKCRRVEVFGRLELLKAFFDGPPFWMIRLRSQTHEDHDLLGEKRGANGHWRFVDEKSAREKFTQLCMIPEYVVDEQKRLKTRERQREQALKLQSTGQLKPFSRDCGK